MATESIPLQVGQRFSRLTLVECVRVTRTFPSRIDTRPLWRCVCDCGGELLVSFHNLTQCLVKSCGCLKAEMIGDRRRTHGLSKSSEIHIWQAMRNRCLNPNDAAYDRYGGRGITVCDRWRLSFTDFYADMGPRPSSRHTLERLDNDAGYCPENCAWATYSDQQRNRRQKTHCKRGHEFTPENTYNTPQHPNWRACRACRRMERKQRRHQR